MNTSWYQPEKPGNDNCFHGTSVELFTRRPANLKENKQLLMPTMKPGNLWERRSAYPSYTYNEKRIMRIPFGAENNSKNRFGF